MNRRSKLPIVAVLIVSLVAAGLCRRWAAAARHAGEGLTEGGEHYGTSAAGLSRMNSFALALLLGGLRGPLVMFLWPSAEEQKQEKNLEDFDTKIEWIRLLQAEFDTVHIFQIWNKAYNISVQMANLSNKYRTILDALDYAHSVDAEKPHDINIIYAIGGIYFDKLGNSAEKAYYRERVREETMARLDLVRVTMPASRQAEFTEIALDVGVWERKLQFAKDQKDDTVSITITKPMADLIKPRFSGRGISYVDRPRPPTHRDEPGWRRTELDPIFDANGHILPQYLKGNLSRPPKLPPNSEWNTGAELQYLQKFDTTPDVGFPYGISPLGLAYNYFKRAQVLQSVYGQRHAQLSDLVVDSRPALTLEYWSHEVWTRGRRAEIEAFAKTVPEDRDEMELTTADLALDAKIDRHAPFQHALFSYSRSAELAEMSLAEYKRHLAHFTTNLTTYLSHMDEIRAHLELIRGDHDYLVALWEPDKRAEMVKSAADHYRLARHRVELVMLTYYTSDDLMKKFYPPNVNKGNIAKANLPDEQLDQLTRTIMSAVPRNKEQYQFGDEFSENVHYLQRIDARLKHLSQQ